MIHTSFVEGQSDFDINFSLQWHAEQSSTTKVIICKHTWTHRVMVYGAVLHCLCNHSRGTSISRKQRDRLDGGISAACSLSIISLGSMLLLFPIGWNTIRLPVCVSLVPECCQKRMTFCLLIQLWLWSVWIIVGQVSLWNGKAAFKMQNFQQTSSFTNAEHINSDPSMGSGPMHSPLLITESY